MEQWEDWGRTKRILTSFIGRVRARTPRGAPFRAVSVRHAPHEACRMILARS